MTGTATTSTWLHRWAVGVALCTAALIFVGGLVTSTGSGLAVPDWPLSFGTVFPKMEGGVKYEHGHRVVAAAVGFLTLVMAIWAARVEPRRWVRGLAWAALGAVCLQGALGGITVLWKLPTPVSVSHACLAQLFFCLTVTLALVTGPWWQAAKLEGDPAPWRARPSLPALGALASATVFVQLVLGALLRHLGAWQDIPTFPDVFGGVLPPASSPSGVWIHFAHRAFALAVALVLGWLVVRIHARHAGEPRLVWLAQGLAGLLVLQVTLGALIVLDRRPVIVTTAHVATGALLLAGSWLVTLRALRLAPPPHGEAR